MSNKNRTVIYIGVTSDLYTRVYQHKNSVGSIFTKKYNCTDIIYYEFYSSIVEAISREKQLKNWKREWKDNISKTLNPNLEDLFHQIENLR